VTEPLFSTLDSAGIAHLISNARHSVCYAGPGIQLKPALAMIEVARRIGPEMITVAVDFNERVMRMGYGDVAAVKCLRDANIIVGSVPGLRTAICIVDEQGFIFTPTALYLEAEPHGETAINAMRLTSQQVAEALARISPAAKAIALAQAVTPEERSRISALPVEVATVPITETQFAVVDTRLREAPPTNFDVARQVRVFEAYLQYVELTLTGASIQRHRLAIPSVLQKLGGSKELEGRLRTTFELIEQGSKLSSKAIEDELNEIRKNFTPSLGKDHGRVVLKNAKALLEKRIRELREKLKAHQQTVAAELQAQLDESRRQIVDYYLPIVMSSPPDALLGQISGELTASDARYWLDSILQSAFPAAADLIEKMQLDERYKDVTFETLNRADFLASVKKAFPGVNWDRTYSEFKAAGESRC
jgi:hypothetical protein